MIPSLETTDEKNDEFFFAEIPENDNETPKASANDLREMANAHYANSDFDTALTLYTSALEAFEVENQNRSQTQSQNDGAQNDGGGDDNDFEYINLKVIYLCNRSTCLYRMEMYEESRADAVEAVRISNGEFIKVVTRVIIVIVIETSQSWLA